MNFQHRDFFCDFACPLTFNVLSLKNPTAKESLINKQEARPLESSYKPSLSRESRPFMTAYKPSPPRLPLATVFTPSPPKEPQVAVSP